MDSPLWNTSPTKQQPWPEGNSSLVLICRTVPLSELSVFLSVPGLSGLFLPVRLLCLGIHCVLSVYAFCVLFCFFTCVSVSSVLEPQFCATGTFQLWGQSIQVDWAEPEKDVEEEVMQRVRVIYVSQWITEDMTAELLSEVTTT